MNTKEKVPSAPSTRRPLTWSQTWLAVLFVISVCANIGMGLNLIMAESEAALASSAKARALHSGFTNGFDNGFDEGWESGRSNAMARLTRGAVTFDEITAFKLAKTENGAHVLWLVSESLSSQPNSNVIFASVCNHIEAEHKANMETLAGQTKSEIKKKLDSIQRGTSKGHYTVEELEEALRLKP